MKQFIKRALCRVVKRDYIVLNPEWTVLFRDGDTAQVGRRRLLQTPYLPVRYGYHVAEPWRLTYAIRGAGAGRLTYVLGEPGAPAFCEYAFDVVLPHTVTVTRTDGVVTLNGRSVPLQPGAELPSNARSLVASLEFVAADGTRLTRRMAHRIRRPPSRAYDEVYFTGAIYERYDDQARGILPFVLDTVAKHAPLSGRLLDIGCATGILVEAAAARGMDAEGIDFSTWAIARANERTGGRCRVLDLETSGPADFAAPYDVIVAHSILEHLSDPSRAIGLMFDLCRPGGIVYIETLNADSLMHRMTGDDWCGYSDFTHRSSWITADWLLDAARSAGFEISALSRQSVWNDNAVDDVWRAFGAFVQMHPARVLLNDHFGDTVEAVLRRPAS